MVIRKIADRICISAPDGALDRPVIGMLKGSERTLFFDAGSSPAHVAEIKAAMPVHGIHEPDFIVVSHSHADHWFGLIDYQTIGICSRRCMEEIDGMTRMDWGRASYERTIAEGRGSLFLADILDKEYGENRTGIRLEKPEISYENNMVIDLGSLTAVVEEIRSDHSPGQTVLYVPEEGVVFLGDCLYLRAKSRPDVDTLFERIEKYQAEYYIDSHREEVMNLEEARAYCLAYIESI